MSGEGKPRFKSNWLTWTVDRLDRSFRVFVVEPRRYDLAQHRDIFHAALKFFLPPTPEEPLVGFSNALRPRPSAANERFDLLTFPEAFLDATTLIEFLGIASGSGLANGCIHVGLCPSNSATTGTHLFKKCQIERLIANLREIIPVYHDDLRWFEDWLNDQGENDHFNLGCLFMVDGDGRIRICLHPKLVRSDAEQSVLPEHDMKEADLLSLITLQPSDPQLLQIHLQPLLCSDALQLVTRQPNRRPLQGMTYDRGIFSGHGSARPEAVDVVSLATCTPTETRITSKRPRKTRRIWHREFRDTFVRAARDDDYQCHHKAIFVMSNFYEMPVGKKNGSLSGAFIPQQYRKTKLHEHVDVAVYGRPPGDLHLEQEAERWVYNEFDGAYDIANEWPMLGYIAAIHPDRIQPSATACMFGFTIDVLPRDVNSWRRTGGLRNVYLLDANGETAPIKFERRNLGL